MRAEQRDEAEGRCFDAVAVATAPPFVPGPCCVAHPSCGTACKTRIFIFAIDRQETSREVRASHVAPILRGKNATALHAGSGVCADNFPRLRLYMPSVGHPTQGAVRPARMRERPLGAREPVRILSREWTPLYLVEHPTQQRQATPSSVQTLMLVILDDHARSWMNERSTHII